MTAAFVDAWFFVLVIALLSALLYTLREPKPFGIHWGRWLLVMSMLTLGSVALPLDFATLAPFTQPMLTVLLLITTTAVLGFIIIQDLARLTPMLKWAWGVAMVIWAGAFLISALLGGEYVGWRMWGDAELPLAAWLSIVGWFLAGGSLIALASYAFYRAHLPEWTNRCAFWMVVTVFTLTSTLLLSSGAVVLESVGALLLTASAIGVLYAIYHHRMPDIRAELIASIQNSTLTLFIWGMLFVVFSLLTRLRLENTLPNLIGIALLALLVALLIIPIRQYVRAVVSYFLKPIKPNIPKATAEYSHNIALATTLSDVVSATNTTLNKTLGIQRVLLILINNTFRQADSVELIVLDNDSTPEKPSYRGFLHKHSPIYHTLAVQKVPLGQYDLVHGGAYRRITSSERAFFNALQVQIYVPIVTEGRLIGILACGDKQNGTAYTREELPLLSVIGQQVGSALRTTRLIDDLQHLNRSMRELNRRLEKAKQELENMDSIKTDFVTIASHELRTPLAQIRGYTDIIDSLNQQSALTKEQTKQLVGNLRKSTERMEELIGAMLDVSQLDVNSMDLRFVRTSPEAVVKMAIEPLKDALEQRKQTLIREGLAGLPHIQADLQRIVQAFRNIILNAIKYTPDGGTITISAQLEPSRDEETQSKILFKFKDTGIGVAAKDRELIFKKFYRGFDTQLHSSGITKFLGAGPGLGLTIAQGIIEGHGGEIWVESPGQDFEKFPGSTFYVRLPISPREGQRLALPFDEEAIPIEKRKTSTVPVITVASEKLGETLDDTKDKNTLISFKPADMPTATSTSQEKGAPPATEDAPND